MIRSKIRLAAPGLMLGALTCLCAVSTAQYHEDFDAYPVDTQVVGLGGWEEWSANAGAFVRKTQAVSLDHSIQIMGPSDLVHQYSGYNSGKWLYTAWQYIPRKPSAESYFILMSSYGATNKWAVQVGFNPATDNVEADAGGGVATTPILYDQWVEIKVLIHMDADWTQFYYNGVLLDSTAVADHPTLGGGWKWTGGYNGTQNGPLNLAAVDLYANADTSGIFYDEISVLPVPTWRDDFDTYLDKSQVVKQGGWEEWGPGAGAFVSSVQHRGPGNSIDIAGASDLVHQYTGYTSGKWEYSAWQYIPKGLTAKSYFILLSSFGTTNKWAVQVGFDPVTGNVVADAGVGTGTTPIVYDQWVPIQVMIDLDADWVQFYYNNILLDSTTEPDHPQLGGGWKWTGGPGGNQGGPLSIGAVDLFANAASSVFYDDMALLPSFKGVRAYGPPTAGSMGEPRVYGSDDAKAGNAKFAIGCRFGPLAKPGVLNLTMADIPQGLPVLGFVLLVNPAPVYLPLPVVADAAGGQSFPLPLPAGTQGVKFFAQYLWIDQVTPKIVLSSSDGLEVLIL